MNTIRPEFVEFIPQVLSPGVLYISERYRTASHLCACGCGEKVVTPLSPARWQLLRRGDQVTLHPSIGNWDYACRSHYWIRGNRVFWSGQLSPAQVASVQVRDRKDVALEVTRRNMKKLASTPPTPSSPQTTNLASTSWVDRLMHRIARLLGD